MPFRSFSAANMYVTDVNISPDKFDIDEKGDFTEEIVNGCVSNCTFYLWPYGLV
ncbi:MAG: hypothetical protein JST26_04790 [Bacteroidetes bacterium]|nr:hypothetical protein [Bacteroidota bacterium]